MSNKTFSVVDEFGVNVFDDEEMRNHLPLNVYKELIEVISEGKTLDSTLADAVAHGMKEWAISKGATHYTHWFQPLNGLTAEKHDSFISMPDKKGKVILEFSGKELIKGEPDASSFPSGGLRATFEARGYTAWDCTSPAFVIQDESGAVLYIPTAFCSYTGEALDEKTPLLRSIDYISEQAIRVLRIFGDKQTKRVTSSAGPEQEYFLLDSDAVIKRKDLVYTGRTLFGAFSPKGQELDDHYFGPIRDKIVSFMKDVNQELWKLGVPAKTEHNEVAPSQHELAPLYAMANVAADQNQLVMLVLKKVARKHNLVCLLSEKPFAGVNGSGKHNNWSLTTNLGVNLLKPGKNPHDNIQFLVFLTAVIKACDEYGTLLRESVASYGNDFRLGADEAPPAILSVFLGDELSAIVDEIVSSGERHFNKQDVILNIGAKTLPTLYRDTTDRNRTSPFAFTGNRFEFRMVGSEQNIAGPNVVLNTIVGRELKDFADYVEKSEEVSSAINSWIKENLTEHQRIIFNGDGYSEDWVIEAKKRGLPNLKTAVEAIDVLNQDEIIELFAESKVLSPLEVKSRALIKYESYTNYALIDAKTMSHMTHKLYIPTVHKYVLSLSKEAKNLEELKLKNGSTMSLLSKTLNLLDKVNLAVEQLDYLILESKNYNGRELAYFIKDRLIPSMKELREPVDQLELLVDKSIWPVPSYGDLLFHIN